MTILLLFFCSGATALVYEVIWSKYLTLLFGSTIQAQTVVLAVFMGGLALGNRIFGSRADVAKQPLALYGYLEVAIGLYAFFFSSIYKSADALFATIGSNMLDHGGWLLLFKGVFSAGLLLGPTILMGGTLPVLAGWLQKSTPDAGRRSARFYSTNSLGAVCGAGLAGFFLVTWIGLPVTLQLTALINVLIGFTAVGISRMSKASLAPTPAALKSASAPDPIQNAAGVLRWGCVVVALTGAVSMGLEVLASRCLCLIFGASLQAFAIVLMAFILGIGVGSAVIASPRRKHWPKGATTIALLLGAATWIGVLVFNIEGLVEAYRHVRTGLANSVMGYRFYQLVAAAFAIVMLSLPAAALGAVLPLWIQMVSKTSDLLGDRVGRLLTWNTLGAVAGVLLTGFLLMPKIGLRGSFMVLALVLSSAALVAALAQRKRAVAVLATAVGAALVVALMSGGEGWRMVLGSGVFRWREAEVKSSIRERLKNVHQLFYEDAADATVSVDEGDSDTARQRTLRINGKADASSMTDLSTQLLLAHLPLTMKLESKDVFVFGMGSGITAGTVLSHPIERLTVAENCEPVLRAARLFEPWNNGVLTNSRVRILREDARTVLKLDAQKYDAIIAEPSNPWTIGVGSVFSREFYQIAARRLKPGGIMAQWFHVYEMNDDIVEMVIRTFATVFPVMEIWETNPGDIIMLGSSQPWKSDLEAYQGIFARERPRQDLESIGLMTPEMLLARQFASQRTAFAVPGEGPIQTDEFPLLEYRAPRAFYVGLGARRFCFFDERTWQADIAPAQKTSVLAALDANVVKRVFGKYGSVNAELHDYLQRAWDGKLCATLERTGGGNWLPCAFGVTNCGPMKPPPGTSTNEVARRLFEAELILDSGADAAGEARALEEIRKVLQTTVNYQTDSGWSAVYYTSLVVKRHLRRGEGQAARQVLLRGLQLEPSSKSLAYLGRVLIREGILQPSDLSSPTPQRTSQPPPKPAA